MFDHVSLMPQAVWWAVSLRLISTVVIANSTTFLSYVSIRATLLVMGRRTHRVIPRRELAK